MRYLIAAAALLLAMAFDADTGAHAALYKWCAYYTNGGTNCGFPTRWACQASVSGAGGLCSINPRWRGRYR
jgi:hypothetical protein